MRFILSITKKIFFALSFLTVVSCGPVEYMGQVGVKATKSHAALKQARGKKYSPYEYWASKYYLERARYKAGYGDYQDAVTYGKKARKLSVYGKKRAIIEKKRAIEIGNTEKAAAAIEKETPKPKKIKLRISVEKKGDNK